MKKLQIVTILVLFVFLISCEKDEFGNIDGNQSPFGEVGNTISIRAGQLGVTDGSMRVSKLENGISSFTCSASTTNSVYAGYVKLFPKELFPGTLDITGNSLTATLNAKVTDKGIQAIFNDGSKLTCIDYDAKVGDKYTSKVGGVTIENEVIEKSTDDDYFWGGMYIKVITVKSISPVPGVSYVTHSYNHKFGLVNVTIHFENGEIKYIGIEC